MKLAVTKATKHDAVDFLHVPRAMRIVACHSIGGVLEVYSREIDRDVTGRNEGADGKSFSVEGVPLRSGRRIDDITNRAV